MIHILKVFSDVFKNAKSDFQNVWYLIKKTYDLYYIQFSKLKTQN